MDRQKSTIWLDLDDVCAAWSEAVATVLDIEVERNGSWIPVAEWKRLGAHDRFYRHLPILDGAHELVSWATEFAADTDRHLAFLTAIPPDGTVPYCREDKIFWVSTHFPHVPIVFGPYPADKVNHCRPGDILIDDRPENVTAWIEAGGIGHLYTSWEECRQWIESTLENK